MAVPVQSSAVVAATACRRIHFVASTVNHRRYQRNKLERRTLFVFFFLFCFCCEAMLVETNGEVTSPMLDGNDKQIFQIVIPKVSFRDVSSNR